MKIRFLMYLFLVIVFTSSVTALVTGLYGYSVVRDILENEKENVLVALRNDLITYDKMLFTIEQSIHRRADISLMNIVDIIVDEGGELEWDLSEEELKRLALDNGVTDISLINREGIVVNSSSEKDIDSNLFGFSSRFREFIESVFGRGRIFGHRISISVSTGRMTMFKYYSPEGTDFIVEIWIDVEKYVLSEFTPDFHAFIFDTFFTRITKENRYLKDIGLYIGSQRPKAGLPLIRSGSPLTGDVHELIERLDREKEIRYEEGETITLYTLFTLENTGLQFTNKVLVKLNYDFGTLFAFTRNFVLYSALSSAGIIVIVYFLSSILFNRYILRRISYINTCVGKIAGGDYDISSSLPGDDDISQIASNIERMKESIVEREKDLRRNQSELIDARNELERKVEERTAELTFANLELKREIEERKQSEKALSEAKAKVEAANNSRNLLIAKMSHELRTPLHAIIGFSQLLEKSDPAGKNDRAIDMIRTSGENLLKLISKVLDSSMLDPYVSSIEDEKIERNLMEKEELISGMAKLPPKPRLELYPAVKSLDFDSAMEVVDGIRDQDPLLSEALADILMHYRFDFVAELIERSDEILSKESF